MSRDDMNSKDLSKREQLNAHLRDTISELWWCIYSGCLKVGFSTEQSFALLQTFILSQNPAGIYPPRERGPDDVGT